MKYKVSNYISDSKPGLFYDLRYGPVDGLAPDWWPRRRSEQRTLWASRHRSKRHLGPALTTGSLFFKEKRFETLPPTRVSQLGVISTSLPLSQTLPGPILFYFGFFEREKLPRHAMFVLLVPLKKDFTLEIIFHKRRFNFLLLKMMFTKFLWRFYVSLKMSRLVSWLSRC